MTSALANAPSLEALRSALDPLEFMAGWNKHEPSLWKEPRTRYVPMLWKWADAKVGLDTRDSGGTPAPRATPTAPRCPPRRRAA